MLVPWISLPTSWKLEDVQAGLNVIITGVSFLAAFVFVRYCWQRAAKRVARGSAIPLHSLLSVNTLGEVVDVIFLLNRKLFSRRYSGILSQCLVVVLLSTSAILSGPIARFSTRSWHITTSQDVPGLLASWDTSGVLYGNVDWNDTYAKLEAANYPLDQLLDYWPNSTINWVYQPEEWNNTWSFNCQYTEKTTIPVETAVNCSDWRYELTGLEEAFSFAWDSMDSYYGGYTKPGEWKDGWEIAYGTNFSGWNATASTYSSLDMLIAFIHWHDLNTSTTDSSCKFAPNQSSEVDYTKIECHLETRPGTTARRYAAYPDLNNNHQVFVPQAYVVYYFAKLYHESAVDTPITIITPRELQRFYQAYIITKDVQLPNPVTRRLSVQVPVVQISAISLIVASIFAALVIFGLTNMGFFAIRNKDTVLMTPLTKVDWMMQSIQAEDRPHTDRKGRSRKSVTVDSLAHLDRMPHFKRQRGEFENARYGGRETTTWFLDDQQPRSQYSNNRDSSGGGSKEVLSSVSHVIDKDDYRTTTHYVGSELNALEEEDTLYSPEHVWHAMPEPFPTRRNSRGGKYFQLHQ